MTVLEQRYRRLLTLLPTGYRHAWEEDMVETYLSLAGDEKPRRRVRMAEAWAVVSLAARLRLTGRSDSAIQGRQAARYVVLAILLFQFAEIAVRIRNGIVTMIWYSYGAPLVYVPGVLVEASGLLLIGAAFWAVLWAKRSLALGLAVLVAVRELTLQLFAPLTAGWLIGGHQLPFHAAYLLMDAIVVGGVFLLYRTETPAIRRSGWLVAVPVTTGALFLFFRVLPEYLDVRATDFWSTGAAVMMVATLAGLFWSRANALLRWASAAPVFAAVAVFFEAVHDFLLLGVPGGATYGFTRFAVQASILVALAVALRLRVRQIRHSAVTAS